MDLHQITATEENRKEQFCLVSTDPIQYMDVEHVAVQIYYRNQLKINRVRTQQTHTSQHT